MKKVVALFAGVMLCLPIAVSAQESKEKELERLQASEKVLSDIMAAPDKGIPEEILSEANCVTVIPSMLKGGFVFGARYGRGVATCRTASKGWSAPAPVRIEGGSWGLQIGGQAVDLVMLVMNEQGMQNLLSSKFKVGADASAAAGPVGRHVEGSTDWKMRAQILTYSRARGAFAGVTINGAVLKQDTDDTLALYGKYVPFKDILTGKVSPPKGSQPFLAEVAKYFRQANAMDRRQEASDRREKAAEEKREAASKAAAENPPATGGTAGSASAQSGSGQTGSESTGAVAGSTQTENSTTSSTTTETKSGGTDQVQSKIQGALQNTAGLSAGDVKVDVSNDTVTLSGSVPTAKDRATARRIAQENAGGRKVDDSGLTVK